jgi:hypothetical protein
MLNRNKIILAALVLSIIAAVSIIEISDNYNSIPKQAIKSTSVNSSSLSTLGSGKVILGNPHINKLSKNLVQYTTDPSRIAIQDSMPTESSLFVYNKSSIATWKDNHQSINYSGKQYFYQIYKRKVYDGTFFNGTGRYCALARKGSDDFDWKNWTVLFCSNESADVYNYVNSGEVPISVVK